MSTPQYIIVGRLRADDRAVLRVASGPLAYKSELEAFSEYRAVTWSESDALRRELATLPWLTPDERRTLSLKLEQILNLF